MRNRAALPLLAAAASLSIAACASKDPDRPTAADATWSTWPGTISLADGAGEQPVSWVIRLQQNNEAGSFLYAPPGGGEQKYEMRKMKYDGSTLSYSWETAEGAKMDCRLQKRSSTLLSGDCLDASGQRGATMSIKPPPGRLD
jgi:hypothetical protein